MKDIIIITTTTIKQQYGVKYISFIYLLLLLWLI